MLDWSMPTAPRRWLVRWVTVPRPDSKEISGAMPNCNLPACESD